ncbi:hypothetical protein SDC9_165561 [bioreactor metagenome]|uniref:Uncharacterized protein n=1 Tax=bioreactor metagenome TaxID=1076179 RepID=A0A645FWW6_9ZZZZ
MADAVGNEHAKEGPHCHDAFTTEVEDAGSLVEHLPERGDQEGYREGDSQTQDVYDEVHAVTSLVFFPRPCTLRQTFSIR